jgi:TatD DNase family protein
VFDSHCHPTDLDCPQSAIRAACQQKVALLCCGYNGEANHKVIQLRDRVPQLPIALGLHPWFAGEAVEPTLDLVSREHPTAIGEVGLDLWGDVDEQALDRQRQVLDAQLHLATRLGLPVTLHSRRAAQPLLEVVKNHRGLRGALHAYSGSFEQLAPFLKLGFFLGVGGAVTRSRARRVRDCAARAPLDQILLETDAPSIGMDGVEPADVRPEHVVRVAQSLALLRRVDLSTLIAHTDRNAEQLYGSAVTAALSWVGARGD